MLHTGDRHAVSEGLISRAVTCAGNIGPKIWKSLKPFAFERCQPPYELSGSHRMQGVERVTAAWMGLQSTAQVAVFRSGTAVDSRDVGVAHEIGRVFVLAGTLCADYAIRRVFVASLLRKNTVPISSIQRVTDIWLYADPIAAVMILPVDNVAGDAVALTDRRGGAAPLSRLADQRHVVAARPVPRGHCGCHVVRPGIAGINPMVLI